MAVIAQADKITERLCGGVIDILTRLHRSAGAAVLYFARH